MISNDKKYAMKWDTIKKYTQRLLLILTTGGLARIEAASADQLFIHFSDYVPILIDLINATAALIGFALIFKAFLKLKIYGEMRSMMAPHARLNQILLLLLVGTLLIAIPHATTSVLLDAFFGNPTIKGLEYGAYSSFSDEIEYAAKRVVQLIGSIALVRGIVQLSSHQEGGRNSASKSITHIIAGVFAINVQATIHLLHGLFI